jgi:hypothetical protein
MTLNRNCWTSADLRNSERELLVEGTRSASSEILALRREVAISNQMISAMTNEMKEMRQLMNCSDRNNGTGSIFVQQDIEECDNVANAPIISTLSARNRSHTVGDLYLDWYFHHVFIPAQCSVETAFSLDTASRSLFNKYNKLIRYMNNYFSGPKGSQVPSENGFDSRDEYYKMLIDRSMYIQNTLKIVLASDEVEFLLPSTLRRKKKVRPEDVFLGIEVTYKKLQFLLGTVENNVSEQFKEYLVNVGTFTVSLRLRLLRKILAPLLQLCSIK